MGKGINRANRVEKAIKTLLESGSSQNDICVFLSHKSEDKVSARKIADYLCDAGIDYYLDELDDTLQQAALAKDPHAVTESIKKGIRESTHILVIVSAVTFDSPWIPFEIGFGHAAIGTQGHRLALLTLKNAADLPLPDFMRTAYDIKGTKSLNVYISSITGLNESLLKSETRIFSHTMFNHVLDDVLKWDA